MWCSHLTRNVAGLKLYENDCYAVSCRSLKEVGDAFAVIESKDMMVKNVWVSPEMIPDMAKKSGWRKNSWRIMGKRGRTRLTLWGARLHLYCPGYFIPWAERELKPKKKAVRRDKRHLGKSG